MPIFRSQPAVVEAFQVPPEGEACSEEMEKFLADADENHLIDNIGDGSIVVTTNHGPTTAAPGDWIIKTEAGEYYPCENEVFERRYAHVDVTALSAVAALPVKSQADPQLVEAMRGLLVRAERGEIESFVMAIRETDGGLNFAVASLPWNGVTLSALLHDEMLRLMRTQGMALRT